MSVLPSTTAVSLQTTDQLVTLPPPWLAEALLVTQLCRTTGLLDRLQQQVRLERGRAGRYPVLDFVLVVDGGATCNGLILAEARPAIIGISPRDAQRA